MTHGIDERKRWLALIVLCLGVLMIVLDTTIVNVALPFIRADLGPEALAQPGARPMQMKGRALEGYIYVDHPALNDRAVQVCIRLALPYVLSLLPKYSTCEARAGEGEEEIALCSTLERFRLSIARARVGIAL